MPAFDKKGKENCPQPLGGNFEDLIVKKLPNPTTIQGLIDYCNKAPLSSLIKSVKRNMTYRACGVKDLEEEMCTTGILLWPKSFLDKAVTMMPEGKRKETK